MACHFDLIQSPSMDVDEKVFFYAIIIDSQSNLARERYRCIFTTTSRRTKGVIGYWSKNI